MPRKTGSTNHRPRPIPARRHRRRPSQRRRRTARHRATRRPGRVDCRRSREDRTPGTNAAWLGRRRLPGRRQGICWSPLPRASSCCCLASAAWAGRSPARRTAGPRRAMARRLANRTGARQPSSPSRASTGRPRSPGSFVRSRTSTTSPWVRDDARDSSPSPSLAMLTRCKSPAVEHAVGTHLHGQGVPRQDQSAATPDPSTRRQGRRLPARRRRGRAGAVWLPRQVVPADSVPDHVPAVGRREPSEQRRRRQGAPDGTNGRPGRCPASHRRDGRRGHVPAAPDGRGSGAHGRRVLLSRRLRPVCQVGQAPRRGSRAGAVVRQGRAEHRALHLQA